MVYLTFDKNDYDNTVKIKNDNDTKEVARIVFKDNRKSKSIFLNPDVYEDPDDDKKVSDIRINRSEGVIIPVFENLKKQNYRFSITGKSGSGKSYYAGDVIDKLVKLKNIENIFILSGVIEDEPLDKKRSNITPQRINLTDERLFQLKASHFKNSIVVFDDVEMIIDKSVKNYLVALRNSIFEVGRHHNIHIINISHNLLSGVLTKVVNQESNYLVIFPKYANAYNLSNYLKRYVGLDQEQIERIMKRTKSRAVLIKQNAPSISIDETSVRLL